MNFQAAALQPGLAQTYIQGLGARLKCELQQQYNVFDSDRCVLQHPACFSAHTFLQSPSLVAMLFLAWSAGRGTQSNAESESTEIPGGRLGRIFCAVVILRSKVQSGIGVISAGCGDYGCCSSVNITIKPQKYRCSLLTLELLLLRLAVGYR